MALADETMQVSVLFSAATIRIQLQTDKEVVQLWTETEQDLLRLTARRISFSADLHSFVDWKTEDNSARCDDLRFERQRPQIRQYSLPGHNCGGKNLFRNNYNLICKTF